jgi:hypothetical protein
MLVAGAFSGPATAQLLLDGFSAPVGGWTRTATGARGTDGATVRVCEAGLPVPGGARDVVHAIFINPLNSVSAVAVGHGRLRASRRERG